jgi:hypothetical protein
MSAKYRAYGRDVCMSGKQRTYSDAIFVTVTGAE